MQKIDLCVGVVDGALTDMQLPLFVHSLVRSNDLSRVDVHMMKNKVGPFRPEIEEWMDGLRSKYGWHVDDIPDDVYRTDTCANINATTRWMVDNCGTNPWVFFSHLDMDFTGPIVKFYLEKIDNPIRANLGQVGEYTKGFVGWRREALKGCLSFELQFDCLYVVMDPWEKRYKIRRGDDVERCTDFSIHLNNFDCFEILQLEMAQRGWYIHTQGQSNAELTGEFRRHVGTHKGHNPDFQWKRADVGGELLKYGLRPIPCAQRLEHYPQRHE